MLICQKHKLHYTKDGIVDMLFLKFHRGEYHISYETYQPQTKKYTILKTYIVDDYKKANEMINKWKAEK